MLLVAGLVAGAREDGQARIFGESGISFAEFAEQKHGTFAGFDELGVTAIGAQAGAFDLWNI